MYRSRLEARWAAFFDRLGWAYEYEPFDLGAWSPDFAITDPFKALIEVKPMTEPDHELFERCQGAAEKNGHRGLVLVTRVAPLVLEDAGFIGIGWWAASYQPVAIGWAIDQQQPRMWPDFLTVTSDRENWITSKAQGHVEKQPGPKLRTYPEHTMRLWADATNAVQWEPR
jgi:hypothetical protein